MMVVTHEMGFARKVANRVIFMDEGKIVEDADKGLLCQSAIRACQRFPRQNTPLMVFSAHTARYAQLIFCHIIRQCYLCGRLSLLSFTYPINGR